jgi:F-type H+-transporting ATPase subunit a
MPDASVESVPNVVQIPAPKGEKWEFEKLNASHNSPYPAIEWIHGSPVLLLNVAQYADINFNRLTEGHEGPPAPSAEYQAWANDYVTNYESFTDDAGNARHFKGIQDHGVAVDRLATAMTAAAAEAPAMPRALSFFSQQTFWSTIALVFLALLLLVVCRRRPDQVKPQGAFQHMMESVVLFTRDDIVRPNIHDHADAWVPYFSAMLLTFLAMNLFGLIPFCATATGNIGVTAAFAVTTFVLTIFMGIKENGIGGFWFALIPVKFSFKPIDLFVYFLLMILEWLSLIIRPVVLAIRLFANMLAGHTVLLVFASLAFIVFAAPEHSLGLSVPLGIFGWVLAVAFYALELLVAFIQAYIFTLLSAVFIGMCAHPEH